ncbi:MAG: SAM-dependent methyltransferase [Rhizobiales bacterium]|nr:SAM-dependent methyltransferase [Hyphomicrobiales bacterium]
MRLDRYMALCLGHPLHGYYMVREAFGEEGDFITAPEISQVFGELIGIWCVAAWQAMGAPASFNLVELGPGRGTLMADIGRTAKVAPGFLESAKVHLVETSPRLREIQKQAIKTGATWHDTLATVPEGPMVLVANEFFDAIPIRQFERRDGHWRERCVGLAGEALTIGLTDSEAVAGQEAPGKDGDVIEFASLRSDIAGEIGARLARHPGAALIIDYGHLLSAPGDTLQAVRKHKHVPVTERPGECDLTSHVDFEALAKALRQGGAVPWPGLTQRTFLMAMGLEPRTAVLAARADKGMAGMLKRAMGRLADESQMGNLFKVLTATSPGLATPYPFGSP